MTLLALAQQQDAAYLYELDDSTSTATDDMGNANGTYVASPTQQQTGPHGDANAVTFNGSSQYVALTTMPLIAASLTAKKGFTFFCWVKSSTTGTRMDLFGSLDTTIDTDLQLRVNCDGSTSTATGAGHLYCIIKGDHDANGVGTSESVAYDTDSGITDGEWHAVAVVGTTDSIKIYLDGVDLSEDEDHWSNPADGNPAGFGSALPNAMYLGASNNVGTAINFWNGSLSQCVWLPWAISHEAITELARSDADRITCTPTPASPYTVVPRDITRYCVDVEVPEDGEYAVSAVVNAADQAETITVYHDSNSTTKTIERDHLANRDGATIENGVVAELKRGTRTVAVEGLGGTAGPKVRGFIVRGPDSESGTVIEAGSGTHCEPRHIYHEGVRVDIGSRLHDGARFAWSKYGSAKIFEGVTNDDEDRYHNGGCVLSHENGLVFLSIGHSEPYIRLKTCTKKDFSDLSDQSVLSTSGGASASLTYCHAGFTSDDKIKVLVRDQQGDDGLALVTISGVFTTPTVDSTDYIIGGGKPHSASSTGALHYPRSMYIDSNDDIYVLSQHRETTNNWQEICGCWYDSSEDTWKCLDGTNETGTGPGSIANPRFTDPDVTVLVDVEAGGNPQHYLLAGSAWDGSGATPKFVGVMTSSDDPSALNYSNVTTKLLSWDGSTLTTTTMNQINTGNSYRQDCAIKYRDSAAILAVTDRGLYKPHTNYDEEAMYYGGWGGPRIRIFEITDPFTSTPTLTEWDEPEIVGDTAGWLEMVSGTDQDILAYQALHEGDHLNFAQTEVTEYRIRSTDSDTINQIATRVGVPTSDLATEIADIDTVVDAMNVILAKLQFTGNLVNTNVKQINDATVYGDGTPENKWTGVP